MKISSISDLENITNDIKKKILPGDYIFLYGEIGVGKTTFVRSLQKIFSGSIFLEEFQENKFLKEFYNSGEYSFETEMQFLLDRSLQVNKFFKDEH